MIYRNSSVNFAFLENERVIREDGRPASAQLPLGITTEVCAYSFCPFSVGGRGAMPTQGRVRPSQLTHVVVGTRLAGGLRRSYC